MCQSELRSNVQEESKEPMSQGVEPINEKS